MYLPNFLINLTQLSITSGISLPVIYKKKQTKYLRETSGGLQYIT